MTTVPLYIKDAFNAGDKTLACFAGVGGKNAGDKKKHITFVVDRSPSMQQKVNALGMVCDTLRHAMDTLPSGIAVTIILFAGHAETLFDTDSLDLAGRQDANVLLQSVTQRNATNLHAGLTKANEAICKHENCEPYLIVCTDGDSNDGPLKGKAAAPDLAAMVTDIEVHTILFTGHADYCFSDAVCKQSDKNRSYFADHADQLVSILSDIVDKISDGLMCDVNITIKSSKADICDGQRVLDAKQLSDGYDVVFAAAEDTVVEVCRRDGPTFILKLNPIALPQPICDASRFERNKILRRIKVAEAKQKIRTVNNKICAAHIGQGQLNLKEWELVDMSQELKGVKSETEVTDEEDAHAPELRSLGMLVENLQVCVQGNLATQATLEQCPDQPEPEEGDVQIVPVTPGACQDEGVTYRSCGACGAEAGPNVVYSEKFKSRMATYHEEVAKVQKYNAKMTTARETARARIVCLRAF